MSGFLANIHPKAIGRAIVCTVLERQVVRLRSRHSFTVVAVAGSIGKTSTKLAIAHTLEPTRRVIYQTGNYNDRVTVPLVLFGRQLPNLLNVIAWTKLLIANEQAIRRPYFYDVAVLELGTDQPGDIAEFAYLRPDISVVTAITPEHMEYFKTLDAVAAEELAVCGYSKRVLVNKDDTPAKYLQEVQQLPGRTVETYSVTATATAGTMDSDSLYHIGGGAQVARADYMAQSIPSQSLVGGTVQLRLDGGVAFDAQATILGGQGVKILLAAAAVAQAVGLSQAEIQKGLQEIRPFAGRMRILAGAGGSTIIDDTYNASPAPVIAGLDVLYGAPAAQRIAILGSMNELGDYSPEAHREVGAYCRPGVLDLVVTIGADARAYLAPVASQAGCNVVSFDSPYDAGRYVLEHMQPGAVILAEGSQNGVFAEEAVKLLLAHPADQSKLVRQSDFWLAEKRRQFGPSS